MQNKLKILLLVALLAVSAVAAPAAQAQKITTSKIVQYPATGLWNTFLRQLNVLECSNYSVAAATVEVALKGLDGSAIATVPFLLPGSGTFHLTLNTFVPADSYGTYILSLPGATSEQIDRIRCVTSFYRFADPGSRKQLEYGYVLPVMNPQQGTSAGTFNSFNPEGGSVPVANWLSVVNADSFALNGTIELYSQAGELEDSLRVSGLQPGERRDIAVGHVSSQNGGQVVGIYRFVPDNLTQKYFAFEIRYSMRGAGFNFAFPLFASSGSCSTEPVFASTMNPALNWAEIANVSNHTAQLTLEVRNSAGTLIHSEPIALGAFEQHHVFINDFLGAANTGSLRIVCQDPSQEVFLQSLFYGFRPSVVPIMEWAYARQQQGFSLSPGELLAAPANTFLGLYNWARVVDRNLGSAVVDVETYPATSLNIERQAAPLFASGQADVPISAVLPADSVGSVLVGSPVTGGALLGDLIRVLPDIDNNIGAIIPIPAAFVPGEIPKVRLEEVASGLARPIGAVNAGDGSNRLFIVEQFSRIKILKNGSVLPTPFLDITALTAKDGEQGLLGLAFHPNYSANGRFFVDYTDTSGDTRVVEYRVSTGNPDVADPVPVREILVIDQPAPNHNGGHLAFGTDGNLYISSGDGGGQGDPNRNGQNINTLLGKILRINVDGATPYSIPAGNPFIGVDGLDEIYAYGFRNPWRFAVDEMTGRIIVGDVGESSREEVDILTAGGNYGWSVMEGTSCFRPSSNCNRSGKILPISEYSHAFGISITGGFVYRGSEIPQLFGHYLFGDFGSSRIWSLEEKADGTWQRRELLQPGILLSSFGQDEQHELYVADIQGKLFRIRQGAL